MHLRKTLILNVLKIVGGDHLGFIGHNGSQEHFRRLLMLNFNDTMVFLFVDIQYLQF